MLLMNETANDDTDADSQVYESFFSRINQSEGDNGTLLHGKHWNWLGSRFLRHTILICAREE